MRLQCVFSMTPGLAWSKSKYRLASSTFPLAIGNGEMASFGNNSLQGTRHAHLWLAALGAIVLARP
jgi:hypothetical protein